jgi:hypothetical protein
MVAGKIITLLQVIFSHGFQNVSHWMSNLQSTKSIRFMHVRSTLRTANQDLPIGTVPLSTKDLQVARLPHFCHTEMWQNKV